MLAQSDNLAAYVERLSPMEDEALRHARERAASGGMPPVSAETGAMLRLLTRLLGTRTAVEIGSGAGYSGIWIARGMVADGMLTTIDTDPEHLRLARQSYADAGVQDRVRPINGRALDVLPRLTDGAYDMVFLDAVKAEYPAYLENALRLLRPGGMILADNVLWSGKVADPSIRDSDTEGLRTFSASICEDERLDSVVLTLGDGLSISQLLS